MTPRGQAGPLGTMFTGPDPHDRERYLASRWLPAFHRGLPFLRLERAPAWSLDHGPPNGSYSIHGPVSPTLIWGQVSRGCVRMQPRHIREVYRVASRHPTLPVTFIRGPDLVQGRPVVPRGDLPEMPGCPEAALGARRLRRMTPGEPIHDRICGGVDHWFSLTMAGGETVSLELLHDGSLLVELFGIRAISAVAAGTFGLKHTLPHAHHNRGERYIRVLQQQMGREASSRQGAPRPYVLLVDLL